VVSLQSIPAPMISEPVVMDQLSQQLSPLVLGSHQVKLLASLTGIMCDITSTTSQKRSRLKFLLYSGTDVTKNLKLSLLNG
jgi:hypothetical protein